MNIDYQVDDFDNFCIWIGIVEKTDERDYLNMLSEFIDDPLYLNKIYRTIQMARDGYIEKTKEKSTVYIYVMKNGEISIMNHEQLIKTNSYKRLYEDAMYSLNFVLQDKKYKKIHAEFIEYRDYLEGFMVYHVDHVLHVL